MSRRGILVLVVAALCVVFVPSPDGYAKNWGYTNADFSGSYASQWTGTVNFAGGPLAAMNGPYGLVGRVVADGNGNLTARFIESYNGVIRRNAGVGTYEVASDGTLKMVLTYPAPNGQFTFEADGVLFDEGKQVRLIPTAITQPPLPPGYVGMAATASLTRQAKSWGWSEADFCGSYSASYSGTIALPSAHPLATLNGPFAMVGRTTPDCQGSGHATAVESFNGFVFPAETVTTYTVSEDGWVKVIQVGEVTLVFEGALSESGGQVYLMLTELPGAGLPENYVGATMTGIEVRQ